jgi:predicted HAD superfamily Cof-like phosphohydrolase
MAFVVLLRHGRFIADEGSEKPFVDAKDASRFLYVSDAQAAGEATSEAFEIVDANTRVFAELVRLQERERELLDANTRLVKDRRDVDRTAMVDAFHFAAGFPTLAALAKPFVPDAERVRFRARLISEEYVETLAALFGNWKVEPWHWQNLRETISTIIEEHPVEVNLPEAVDGFVDLGYVIEGSFLEFGVDPRPIWLGVHAANMRKFPGGIASVVRHKVVKPAGWVAPDIGGMLRAQGWAA